MARTNLRSLSRKNAPEWAEYTRYSPDPEQFYVGIERRGGRYFMAVKGVQVKRP